MSTNFPASDDVFNVPSDPANTPLVSAGDSSRGHARSHQDLGDALEAMQAQQTILAHSHDGTTFRHGSKLSQANTHQSPDTDSGANALHHTIGTGANQYASGTHTHDAVTTYPVGAFFFAVVSTNPSSLGVAGTWTSVGQRFLCAQGGSLGLTAGATGGSNSHSHTIDASTDTVSAHDHDLSSSTTGSNGGHTHTGLSVASAGASHTHSLFSKSVDTGLVVTGSATWVNDPHTHTSGSASASHSHTSPTLNTTTGHTHTVSSSTTGTGGSHSHTNSTPGTTNNLVPLLVVYMWKRVS